ncbi:hypothetical protein [Sorangium cellulosum]|uniref:hypothetical protein n=1 Tax=Sorangium cellulosum TaxID=56 RepID=UPI0023DDDA80|nr:hypothetical protein [Sorangium cellulosum]
MSDSTRWWRERGRGWVYSTPSMISPLMCGGSASRSAMVAGSSLRAGAAISGILPGGRRCGNEAVQERSLVVQELGRPVQELGRPVQERSLIVQELGRPVQEPNPAVQEPNPAVQEPNPAVQELGRPVQERRQVSYLALPRRASAGTRKQGNLRPPWPI